MPMVGLGLEYGGHVAPEPLQLDQTEPQEQEQVHDQIVATVDEPEEDTGDISLSPSTAPSGPTSQQVFPSTVPSSSDSEQEHESAVDEVAEEGQNAEEEDEEDDDESVSKTQHQLTPPEPMQTIPMPLAVS